MKKWLVAGTMMMVVGFGAGCQASEEAEKPKAEEAVKNEEVKEENVEVKGPVTVKDYADREVTFNEPPTKIVSLTSGDTSIISALGGTLVGRPTIEGQVSADLQSVAEIGNVMSPNMEKIVSLQPDWIIGHATFSTKHLQSLENTKANVFLSKANSVEDIKNTIMTYGQILHKEENATKLISEIDNLKTESKNVKALIVYGTPGEYFAALPASLPGDILAYVGGENIAKDFPQLKEMPQYAKLSMERVVEANPDAVYLIAHGEPNVVKQAFLAEIEKNSAWKNMNAVKNNRVEVLPNDIFGANPGANIVKALEFLDGHLQKAVK